MDSPMTTTPTCAFEQKVDNLAKKQAELQTMFDQLNLRVDTMQPTVRVEVVEEKETVVPPKKEKKAKKVLDTPAFALPWNGTAIAGCCQGIRANYDTFTQCVNPNLKDKLYCKTCSKNCGDIGVPKDGNVETRDASTKKIKPYIHYMNAKKLTKQEVIDEAAKFDVVLGDDIFEKPAPAKGRPKKLVSVDSDEEDTASIQILGLLTDAPKSPTSP